MQQKTKQKQKQKTQENQQKTQQQQIKFNPKQLYEKMSKMKIQLQSLKSYFNKYQQISTNAAQTIFQINQEIKKNKIASLDKSTKKRIKDFAENIEQKTINQKLTKYLKNQIDTWMKQCQEILEEIKLKLKDIDKKSHSKILMKKELSDFKVYLRKRIIEFEEIKHAIVTNFASFQIQQNCMLLEALTNKIQRLGQ